MTRRLAAQGRKISREIPDLLVHLGEGQHAVAAQGVAVAGEQQGADLVERQALGLEDATVAVDDAHDPGTGLREIVGSCGAHVAPPLDDDALSFETFSGVEASVMAHRFRDAPSGDQVGDGVFRVEGRSEPRILDHFRDAES